MNPNKIIPIGISLNTMHNMKLYGFNLQIKKVES